MKKASKKAISMVLLFFVAITMISTKIYASSDSVALVDVEGDYVIYINEMENEEFKFAFTNDTTITESSAITELTFIQNWEDTNGKNIACLEATSTIDQSNPIIMWIQTESEVFSIEINLEDAITKEDMADVESLTQIINVSTENSTTTSANEDGVAMTETVGQIDIIDSDEYDYKYQLIKIDGTETQNAKDLISLVDSLQTSYSSMTMYNKILTTKRVKELYDALKLEGTWLDVTNRVIYQPEDSVDGDQYIVLLQQLSNGTVLKEDIQFLICTDGHEEEFVKEVNEVKQAAALPKTFDSVVLLVILAIVVIMAVVVLTRIKKLSKKDNE